MTSTTAPGSGLDGFSPFAHLTVQNTALYRQVMRAFVAGLAPDDLRKLGVAEQLIGLALAVTGSEELDALVSGAPLLTKDILYGLAAGLTPTRSARRSPHPSRSNSTSPSGRTWTRRSPVPPSPPSTRPSRTSSKRATSVPGRYFSTPPRPSSSTAATAAPSASRAGPAPARRSSPCTGSSTWPRSCPPPGHNKPILLTTFTKNLTTDLRARLASLLEPEQLARIDVTHIDQLAAGVLSENTLSGAGKQRISDSVALNTLRQILVELDEKRWDAEFLYEEWEQVILGQSLGTRKAYFDARRAGRGHSASRPDRARIWKILEQFTTRLDKDNRETWGQAAERAARFETQRASKIKDRQEHKEEMGGRDLIHRDDSSGMYYLGHRYQHVVVDEAQDLRPAHWKMLRAMVASGEDDMFIAGDTHQRIYDQQVTLGTVGVHIRGRAARLILSYRTTREILNRAMEVVNPKSARITFDDLDDGTDNLDGYRSVLRGPAPDLVPCDSWDDELVQLAAALKTWREELATGGVDGRPRDPRGTIAVCVADREAVSQVMYYLATEAGLTVAELTKDGVKGDGDIHVGTMHRFKGLEYQKLAIIGVRDGVIPRASLVQRYRDTDPKRLAREELKARSLLFVAATRARDTLRISWHGKVSPYLPR